MRWPTSRVAEDDVRTERVLHVDPAKDLVIILDVGSEKALPSWRKLSGVRRDFEEGRRRVLRRDPWLGVARSDDQLTDAEREGRDRAWSVIEPVVMAGPEEMLDRRTRGALVKRVVDLGLASKPTVYRWLYRYWRGGQSIHALTPRYRCCGAPGKTRTGNARGGKKRGRPSFVEEMTGQTTGINVDENVRKRLVKIGKEFYEGKRYPHRRAYLEGLKKYFKDGYEPLRDGTLVPTLPLPEQLPTFGQYLYWYRKDRDPDQAKRRREGQRTYDLNYRAIRGDSTSTAFGPGSSYEIDSTVGDVCLVSSRDPRLIIGRPIIYVVVDTFSRLVVGFTVGLEGPSWRSAVLAFTNVTTDKVEFCASMGLEIMPDEWPVEHLPEPVLADRGELKGRNADLLPQYFNVRVAKRRRAAPTGSPWSRNTST